MVAPNNSFKPRPLRGSACVLACSTPPFRAAVRLNSGVRPVQKQLPVNKHQACLHLLFPRLLQAFYPRHKLRAGQSAGTPFLGLASHEEQLSVVGSGEINCLAKSTAGTGLTIRSSRARFAASALAL